MSDASDLPEVAFRRPVEADYAPVVRIVDEWWGGRRIHPNLPRLWFQHFTGTSWIAETPDGRLAGFLVGLVSPDRPDTGYVHLVATDPNLRRRGLGAALYRRFIDDVAAHGVRVVLAVTWPGNRASVGFHRGLGFVPVDGPGARNLYGTTAFPDYDFDREDRVVFRLELPTD